MKEQHRCGWAGTANALDVAYHDVEWGVPVYDDRTLFEFLVLEGAQAGLSWTTILKKRENYRKAFSNFDPAKVAKFDSRKKARLLDDAGIVRNRLKIESAISNARAVRLVQREFGSLSDYLWEFVGGKPIQNKWKSLGEIPAQTPESIRMSKDLRKRGFRFVGPTICYAFMQAVGMVNDHEVRCFRYRAVKLASKGGAWVSGPAENDKELAARLYGELERVQGLLDSANERLEELTYIDPLTDLLNRLGLQKMLTHEQARAKRESTTTLAMLLDLDDFKQINDALGHAVGDLVIKEIAGTLTDSLRSTDYVARIGGDEFMILLPQTRPVEGERVAEKVRLALSESQLSLSPGPVSVTASCSVVEVPPHASVIDELLSAGHPILKESKRLGKNRVTYEWRLNPNTAGSDRPLDDILQDLRRGDRLKSVAHPILRLEDEEAQGYEFLTRSDIESFEMPADFFRICTEANILSIVDYHCFKMCLRASATIDERLRRFINILPSTLVNVPVPDLVDAFPKDRAAGRYYIEISEQQVIGDPSYLLEPIRALRDAGIRIAFDDVGYGRSWLESLILLEPHVVKIDKKWINGISTDSSRARSLCRMLNVVDSLGAEVIAEGIEDRQDLDALRKLGVKYGQGFLWGQPQ